LNGSSAEFDDDNDRASGQVVCDDNEDMDVDSLSCNNEPSLTEVVFDDEDFDAEPRSGSDKEHNPNNRLVECTWNQQLNNTTCLELGK
jgi:hypothetical protein